MFEHRRLPAHLRAEVERARQHAYEWRRWQERDARDARQYFSDMAALGRRDRFNQQKRDKRKGRPTVPEGGGGGTGNYTASGSGGAGYGSYGTMGRPGDAFAELPRYTVPVAIPTVTGTIRPIASGASVATIQSVYNAAQYGDAIEWEAGGQWDLTAEIKVNARAWSGPGAWITVRPSNWAALAAAWPLQADGMPSALAQSATSTNPRMTRSRAATLTLPRLYVHNNQGGIGQMPNAHGWYTWGLRVINKYGQAVYGASNEVARLIGPNYSDDLMSGDITAMSQFPSYHVFNQCSLESDPNNGRVGKGAALNLNWTAFVNSTSEVHHNNGRESACVWIGLGEGPFRIENNAMLGSAINFFIGGVHINDSHTWHVNKFPCDGTIRHNFMHKKDEWLPGHPSYLLTANHGQKNLFEWKIGGRTLAEFNLLEGSVMPHQNGQGFTVKVLNEDYFGPGDPVPGYPDPTYDFTGPGPMWWTETHDTTIRYNRQTKCGSGINISGNQQTTNPGSAITDGFTDGIHEGVQVNKLLVQHNVFEIFTAPEGYDAPRNNEGGIFHGFLQSNIRSGGKPASWWFDHNTFSHHYDTYLAGQSGQPYTPWFSVDNSGADAPWPKWSNNIFSFFPWKWLNRSGGAATVTILNEYWPGVDLDYNIFCRANSGDGAMGAYAGNNHFVANNAAIGLSRDGTLAAGSSARAGGAHDADDGTDNGAHISVLDAGLTGVRLF